jgi:class 3 adenylate cyclase
MSKAVLPNMPTRRLAAILAADVVGYSRLVSADETDALARLSTLRSNIIEPGIAKHSERLFQVMGDGFLVEFASARAIDLDPMFVGGYIGLSAVLSRAKGTQAKEEALARRAVELDAGNADAYSRLALALLAGGDHQGARV